jgi:MarR family 2-MHQ and catechol resistance regulon transcriptional repressor
VPSWVARSFTERGWVVTSTDPDDGRKTLVDLTAGIRAASTERRASHADKALAAALAAADDDERAALIAALARLHRLLVADHAPRRFPDRPFAPPTQKGGRPA